MASSESGAFSHEENGRSSLVMLWTAIIVGTAASQFCEWPLHLSDFQTTTRLSILLVGCASCRCAQHGLALLAINVSILLSQHERVAVVTTDLQHCFEWQTCFMFPGVANQLKSRPAARAWARAKLGGRTPCIRAQAIRSVSVWQQHDCQHCSAVRQPHCDVAHGKFSPLFCGSVPDGSGTPAAVTR